MIDSHVTQLVCWQSVDLLLLYRVKVDGWKEVWPYVTHLYQNNQQFTEKFRLVCWQSVDFLLLYRVNLLTPSCFFTYRQV